MDRLPPCVVYEDDDLLVVIKPAGWNTHAPSPYSGFGIYDWLRHREQRWENLAILHRLDKETSGLMVFGKSQRANRSLTEQFTAREVQKQYVFVTDRTLQSKEFCATSSVQRAGDHYVSRSDVADSTELAETQFKFIRNEGPMNWWSAQPVTGRTHQIRVHAQTSGIPILGDSLYGGGASHRLHLHAESLSFRHPSDHRPCNWTAPPCFQSTVSTELRKASIHPDETNAFRLAHGRADQCPEFLVDRWADWILLEAESESTATAVGRLPDVTKLDPWLSSNPAPWAKGIYVKNRLRRVGTTQPGNVSPVCTRGEPAPHTFLIQENGVQYEISFGDGYSVGLFLDQRDNRRRWIKRWVGKGFPLPTTGNLLNTFSYTCGFSVCAALAGWTSTSLDLSRKYLEWGRRNFQANHLDDTAHEFFHGDSLDWMNRWRKKGRQFDAVILDPPTFSRSKEHGDFRVERDYSQLTELALQILKPGGILFASANTIRLPAEKFLGDLQRVIAQQKRTILNELYVPQPVDFPIISGTPGYLKTVWLRIQ